MKKNILIGIILLAAAVCENKDDENIIFVCSGSFGMSPAAWQGSFYDQLPVIIRTGDKS